MCRYTDGSSFLCSLCSVSEVSEGLRRRHKLHGGILETFKYQHLPQPEGSCRKPTHPCKCEHVLNLVHSSQSKSGDSHEDGAFQTPNPCDCGHLRLRSAKNDDSHAVTEIPRAHAPPHPPLPQTIPGWGGGQERQTPDHTKGLGLGSGVQASWDSVLTYAWLNCLFV